jgi:hypothetical protein
MKAFFFILWNVLILLSIFQCSTAKPEKEVNFIGDKKEQFELQDSNSIINNNKLTLFCNQDTGYFDKSKKILHDNGMLIYCLREKGFLGDTAAVRQIALLFTLMQEPTGYFNKRLRGDKIFKEILDKSKNFEFVNDYDGNLSYNTVYSKYANVFSEMIESIDGISQYDYLNKHIYTKGKSELEAEELFSPKYIQILARLSWEIYKDAYDKGLIKLKDFGQE